MGARARGKSSQYEGYNQPGRGTLTAMDGHIDVAQLMMGDEVIAMEVIVFAAVHVDDGRLNKGDMAKL